MKVLSASFYVREHPPLCCPGSAAIALILKSPLAAIVLAGALLQGPSPAAAAELATAAVEVAGGSDVYAAHGILEAARQTAIAAQVAGRVTDLRVKVGDAVKAGQVLARVDERVALQQATASQALVAAAEAQLDAARREYARSRRLFGKQYLSQAAMEQAEAQYKATEAQVRATVAQAGVASTQTSFHTIRAPYAGVIAEVASELGDTAAPGKPLIRIYDPAALRVVATLPESYAHSLASGRPAKLEFPGAPEAERWQTPVSMTLLPTADPTSHTVQVRLLLPAKVAGLTPGMFARAHLPVDAGPVGRLTLPTKVIVTRTELHAVYVVDKQGRAQLRQVRLGRSTGDRVEVVAGVQAGERVALDPVAAGLQSARK
jgi:RND family efflux transporter MFP subunit